METKYTVRSGQVRSGQVRSGQVRSAPVLVVLYPSFMQVAHLLPDSQKGGEEKREKAYLETRTLVFSHYAYCTNVKKLNGVKFLSCKLYLVLRVTSHPFSLGFRSCNCAKLFNDTAACWLTGSTVCLTLKYATLSIRARRRSDTSSRVKQLRVNRTEIGITFLRQETSSVIE